MSSLNMSMPPATKLLKLLKLFANCFLIRTDKKKLCCL